VPSKKVERRKETMRRSAADDSENAIAYGFFSLCLFLVFSAVLYLCLSYGLNMLTVPINKQIADGTMSSATANARGKFPSARFVSPVDTYSGRDSPLHNLLSKYLYIFYYDS
jgi:hypothetical protein